MNIFYQIQHNSINNYQYFIQNEKEKKILNSEAHFNFFFFRPDFKQCKHAVSQNYFTLPSYLLLTLCFMNSDLWPTYASPCDIWPGLYTGWGRDTGPVASVLSCSWCSGPPRWPPGSMRWRRWTSCLLQGCPVPSEAVHEKITNPSHSVKPKSHP